MPDCSVTRSACAAKRCVQHQLQECAVLCSPCRGLPMPHDEPWSPKHSTRSADRISLMHVSSAANQALVHISSTSTCAAAFGASLLPRRSHEAHAHSSSVEAACLHHPARLLSVETLTACLDSTCATSCASTDASSSSVLQMSSIGAYTTTCTRCCHTVTGHHC